MIVLHGLRISTSSQSDDFCLARRDKGEATNLGLEIVISRGTRVIRDNLALFTASRTAG